MKLFTINGVYIKKVWQTENGLEYIEMYCFEHPL